jgi:hypothetical protein
MKDSSRPARPLRDGTQCTHEGATGTYCTNCWTNLYEASLPSVHDASETDLTNPLPITLVKLSVLGGAGLPLLRNQQIQLVFSEEGFSVQAGAGDPCFAASYSELEAISITGPGRVEQGGGFFGGGFGLDGALVGMAVAGVLNALTKSSQVITILLLAGVSWELWCVTSEYDPLTLRILMGPVFVRLSPEARFGSRR